MDNKEAALLLELLTPVMKSWPSEFCLEANKHAMQVLGGYGYTRDYEVERMYRDNRLNPIHEGTHAIHGIDLLGRKLRINNGAALNLLKQEIAKTIERAAGFTALDEFCCSLKNSLDLVENTIEKVFACEDIELALANATEFLDAFGNVVVAWQWLNQAAIVKRMITDDNSLVNDPYYQGKLQACQFFFRYELIKVKAQLELVATLDDTCRSLDIVCFTGQ